MRSIQIESWALRVIDAVKQGQPNEDFLVELKREWPKAKSKVARQIAGHANAARGESILWLIGVDGNGTVHGASADIDLANWYPSVGKYFDSFAPRLTSLNISVDSLTVVALLFETDRFPFVVKNPTYNSPDGGPVEFEVPWRSGTRTRSARREDLIRLITPLIKKPKIEVLGGSLELCSTYSLLTLDIYITALFDVCITLPFHNCKVWLYFPDESESLNLLILDIKPPGRYVSFDSGNRWHDAFIDEKPSFFESLSPTIQWSEEQLIIKGSGKVTLIAKKDFAEEPNAKRLFESAMNIQVEADLLISDYDSLVKLECHMSPALSNSVVEDTSFPSSAEAYWQVCKGMS